MYFNYKIDNLINGVSSQPVNFRLPNQADTCENFWPSVLSSLSRRPGTNHVAILDDEAWNSSDFFHTIDRSAAEKYILRVNPAGEATVYNLITGEQALLTLTSVDAGYLTCTNPAACLRAITIADRTIILNKEKTVAPSTETSDPQPSSAVVWVKLGASTGEYKIIIKDSLGNTHTASVDMSSHSANVTPAFIASLLETEVESGGYYTATRKAHVLYISPGSRDIATISSEDPIAGTGIETVFGDVDSLGSLPDTAPQGYKVRVAGDSQRNQDDYYVSFRTSGNLATGELGQGSWIETNGYAVALGVDPSTMPVSLENIGFNQFTLKNTEWGQRTVGDQDSAEDPSFVGQTLGGLTFFQGRLVLFSKDSISMSESGEFFNFYPTTTLVIPDSDRVDVTISAPKSGDILYAVPYQARLLLLTREVQFALYGDPIITPGTVSVHPVSYLPYDGDYLPASIGKFLYFGHNQSENFRISEFFVETDGVTYDYVDVSAHAHSFVPKDIIGLSASSDLNALCCQTSSQGNSLFFYKSHWQNNDKVQSAWFNFVFPGVTEIVSSVFVRNILYVIVTRDNRTFLEALEFTDDDTITGFPFSPHLDSRILAADLTLTYDFLTDTTLVEHPALIDGVDYLAISEDRSVHTLDFARTLPGDWTGKDLALGINFDSTYSLPRLIVKPSGGSQRVPVDSLESVQVLAVRVNYEDSLEFDLEVTQGAYGTHTARVQAQLGEIAPGTDWELLNGFLKTLAGAKARDVTVTLRSRGAFPLKATSVSYDLNIYSYQENI